MSFSASDPAPKAPVDGLCAYAAYFTDGEIDASAGMPLAAAVAADRLPQIWTEAVVEALQLAGGEIDQVFSGSPESLKSLAVIGGGEAKLNADGSVSLHNDAGQRAYLAVPLQKPSEPGGAQVIAGVLRPVACADEHFQIRLGHSHGFEEEALRFSDTELAILRRRRLLRRGHDRACCFILLLGPDRAVVWIDGVVVHSGPRSRSTHPTTLVLDLLAQGNAGEIRIESLLVGTGPKALRRLWHDDDRLVRQTVEAAAAGGSAVGCLIDLLANIDDFPAIDAPDVERALGRLLIDRRPRLEEGVWRRFLAICSSEVWPSLEAAWLNQKDFDPLIKMQGVTVRFPRNPSRAHSFEGLFGDRDKDLFEALQRVGFRLSTGEILGVIGRNGSGKSTLLRTITGQHPIQEGEIWTRGRPILLRPGAGMREDLSGRDNIVTAALFMGLSLRQARSIVDEVVDFAELGDHIDRPYKYYSDGMRARLIFSTATAVTSDILLLDELLSAGDVSFQAKAKARLDRFIERARAVIVVEHGLSFVSQSATKVLLLHGGVPLYYGSPSSGVDRYLLDLMAEADHARGLPLQERPK